MTKPLPVVGAERDTWGEKLNEYLTEQEALKASKDSPAFTGTPTGITKAHVDLGSVDDTSDADKPVSTAQGVALGAKLATADADALMAAKVADASPSLTRTALEGVVATQGFGRFHTLRELQRKGGAIGTAGKAVVSIRFDHQLEPLRDSIWPLMVARGLPASVGVVSRYPTGDPYSAAVTWADLHDIVDGGCEVWCHSATHYDPTTYAALIDEIVTSKTEIEAQGFQVCGWHGAGVGANPTYPDWPLTYLTDMMEPTGQLVEANYGFSVGLTSNTVVRQLPHFQYHALHHQTGEVLTLAVTKSVIKQAVSYGCGLSLMYHPHYIGLAGYLSLSDFTAVLDHIVTLRDAGTIEVLTETGLIAADPGRALRAQIIANSTFDPDPNLAWTGWSYGTGVCWRATGGRTGSAVEFDQAGNAKLQQVTSQPGGAGLAGSAVRVEAWMKMTTTAGTGVIRVLDHDTSANLDVTKEFAVTSTGWTKFWFNTVIPPATTRIRIELSRKAGSGSVWMDDISITPV